MQLVIKPTLNLPQLSPEPGELAFQQRAYLQARHELTRLRAAALPLLSPSMSEAMRIGLDWAFQKAEQRFFAAEQALLEWGLQQFNGWNGCARQWLEKVIANPNLSSRQRAVDFLLRLRVS